MKTLTRDANGEPKYDKKTMAAFEGTTAAKVLSVRLDGVAYHALHAKEPKTPEAAELLAKFLAAHAAACGAGPFAWLVDTNLAKESTDSAFRREVEASGLQVSASVPTTSKAVAPPRPVLRRQQVPQDRGRREGQVRGHGRRVDTAADGARPRR